MSSRFLTRLLQILCLFTASSAFGASRLSIVVSVPEQRLYVFNQDGDELTHYRVSTSKFGIGDCQGSYNTPLGQLEIAAKIGSGAMAGTVFKSGNRTGEICPVNSRGRDPIVTRILWLRGKESKNSGAYGRHIYIHGTPDEMHLGRPASYGCIRMRSSDIIALYETVEAGTAVEITTDHVSGGLFAKANRPPAVIASAPAKPKTTTPASSAPAVATVAANSATAKTTPNSAAVKVAPNSSVASNTPSASKTRTLSLSEPLIGAPDNPEPKAGADKKKSGSSNSRKSRS